MGRIFTGIQLGSVDVSSSPLLHRQQLGIVTLSPCHLVTSSHRHIVTSSHRHIVTLSHCHTGCFFDKHSLPTTTKRQSRSVAREIPIRGVALTTSGGPAGRSGSAAMNRGPGKVMSWPYSDLSIASACVSFAGPLASSGNEVRPRSFCIVATPLTGSSALIRTAPAGVSPLAVTFRQ